LEFFRRDPNDFPSRLVAMDETWLYRYDPKTKQQCSGGIAAYEAQKIPSAKFAENISPRFFGNKHPPHCLSFKEPNYQRGVLLFSVGATAGHFEGKKPRDVRQGAFVPARQCPAHCALATQKKLAYLSIQCLEHLPFSTDPAPSDYHLLPGLKKQLKYRYYSSDALFNAAAETSFDRKYPILLSGLRKLEQRAKKCIELRGEYFE